MMSAAPRQKPDFSDVPLRVRSWLYIIAAVAVALCHEGVWCAFVALLVWQGLREFFAMGAWRGVEPAVIAALPAITVFFMAYTGVPYAFLWAVAFAVAIGLLRLRRNGGGGLASWVCVAGVGGLADVYQAGAVWGSVCSGFCLLLVVQWDDVL